MSMSEMVSTYKIASHRDRLERYLRGDPIYPVTVELGLTAACNRECPDCPSSLGNRSLFLDIGCIERLFARLQGHTRGLIITGGEPTLSPVFSQVLEMARCTHGFEDITVVTNGCFLEEENIISGLLSHASAVRISLYDWDASSFDRLEPTFDRIEALRERIETSDSPLEIGVSALTSSENASVLGELTERVRQAGADWIYFHPTCTQDITGARSRKIQKSVLEKIRACQRRRRTGFDVYVLDERYEASEIWFEGYHTAHFALVMGADGKNYLATEVKYQPHYILADLADHWRDDFLWQEQRLEIIRSVSSAQYPAQGSRNRGVLYNTFIEKLKSGIVQLSDESITQAADGYRLPHII